MPKHSNKKKSGFSQGSFVQCKQQSKNQPSKKQPSKKQPYKKQSSTAKYMINKKIFWPPYNTKNVESIKKWTRANHKNAESFTK